MEDMTRNEEGSSATENDGISASSLLLQGVAAGLRAINLEVQLDEDEPDVTDGIITCIEHYTRAIKCAELLLSLPAFDHLEDLHNVSPNDILATGVDVMRERVRSLRERVLAQDFQACGVDNVGGSELLMQQVEQQDAPIEAEENREERSESGEERGMLLSLVKEVNVRWADVAGMEGVKDALSEALLTPLEFPQFFSSCLLKPACKVLLYGPPGTGKTLLAQALAGETGFKFLSVSPSSIFSKWTGESERMIKGVFEMARHCKPAVLFLDELDALGIDRGNGDDVGARRVLTELLLQLNDVDGGQQVLVVGATNRPGDLDAALLRRFDLRLEVPLPDKISREQIINHYMQGIGMNMTEAELSYVGDETEGLSASDLKALCRDVAMRPVREAIASIRSGCNITPRGISISDFQEVLLDLPKNMQKA